MTKKDRIEIRLPDGRIAEGLKPPDEIGGIVFNDKGESYMKFEMHPDARKTTTASWADSPWIVVKKAAIEKVGQDNDDQNGFFLVTKSGPIHVKSTLDKLMSWLEDDNMK